MWTLSNNTPYAAGRAWVRDKDGAEVWLVVVKGTFDIKSDGSIELSEKQEDVLMTPVFAGDPGNSSLLYESDLVRAKVGTDILLHGHAYAPKGSKGKSCRCVDVEFRVGDIRKRLRVFGNRIWKKGLLWGIKISRPQPFEKIPITFEHAFGGSDQKHRKPKKRGWEPRNPIGTGFGTLARHLIGQPLPNIEYHDMLISSWKHRPKPASFGPIPSAWQPRLALAGTYDEAWEDNRHPLLPLDFDDRFYNCAPEDQQSKTPFRGGEVVELRNLTPEGFLSFQLPKVYLDFTTIFTKGQPIHHRATLHTVIIEPDQQRLIMVWHTSLACHPRVLHLDRTTIREKSVVSRQSDHDNPRQDR